MDTVSLHTISKRIFAQWCSCNSCGDPPLQSVWTETVQMLLWDGRHIWIPLGTCRNWTWLSQVGSFNDSYFDACPSLIRSFKCLCVSFFQITVLPPSPCSCLHIPFWIWPWIAYSGTKAESVTEQRAEPSLPSLDVSLDLSFPSADLDEALTLFTPCPSKASLDV